MSRHTEIRIDLRRPARRRARLRAEDRARQRTRVRAFGPSPPAAGTSPDRWPPCSARANATGIRTSATAKDAHSILYARGLSIKAVASEMEMTEETVKSYIKRARRKYRDVGTDIGTKILLRRHVIREGWLDSD